MQTHKTNNKIDKTIVNLVDSDVIAAIVIQANLVATEKDWELQAPVLPNTYAEAQIFLPPSIRQEKEKDKFTWEIPDLPLCQAMDVIFEKFVNKYFYVSC